MAKWSPLSERIAMIRGPDLWVANGDGSNLHMVADGGQYGFTVRNLAWSPDGDWVVVHAPTSTFGWDGPLVLIQVDTGLQLPLGYRNDVSQATWGP